jgi:hypothetical protein
MNIRRLKPIIATAALLACAHASAQISFYEHEGFRGRVFTADGQVANFERQGFNDRASSVVVDRGRWEVCENARFEGRCVIVRRGSYDSLRGLGLNDRISSYARSTTAASTTTRCRSRSPRRTTNTGGVRTSASSKHR